MKWIKFISSLVISYILGFTLNEGLSSTNLIREPVKNGINILEYDIPFVYTVGLNEMLLVFSLTIILFLIFNCYYSKSKASKQQLFILLIKSLWIESIVFSFVIGTLTNKILKDLKYLKDDKMEFFECFPWVFIILFFSLVIFIAMIKDYLNNNDFEEKYLNDLYPSRERLLSLIDYYLKSSHRLSIVGDWGIGKTKIIENFFYGEYFLGKDSEKPFRESYSMIYIDTSTFCENKKIIENLENQLQKILKNNKIMGISEEFTRKFFIQLETFIGKIYNLFFEDYDFQESRKILNEKIKEFYKITDKFIVICLDNIERINDKERIISLLSMFDEVLSENIKIIYLYDEKHMREIFNKEQYNFDKYIEKYVLNKIQIEEIQVEEILEGDDKLKITFIELKNRMDKTVEVMNTLLKDHKKIQDIDKLKKEFYELVIKKIEEINYRLKNPRFLIYLKNFLIKEREEMEERLEYKIIREFFQTLNLEFFEKMTFRDLVNPNIFEELENHDKEMHFLVEKKIVQYMFLSEKNFEFTELNLKQKKATYKALFLNQKKQIVHSKKMYKDKLRKIKNQKFVTPLDIDNIGSILNSQNKKSTRKYKRQLKNILRKGSFKKNIRLKNYTDLRIFLSIEKIEFYITKNNIEYVVEGVEKELEIAEKIKIEKEIKKIMIQHYFMYNDYFNNLFQLKNKEQYIKIINYKNEKEKEIEKFYKIFNADTENEFIEKIKDILTENKKIVNKINENKSEYIYEALLKKIEMIEKKIEIKKIRQDEKLNLKILSLLEVSDLNYYYLKSNFLDKIILKEDYIEFNFEEIEKKFILKREELKDLKIKLIELENSEELKKSDKDKKEFKFVKNIILTEICRFEKNI